MARARILLDSNIWRYVVDAGKEDQLPALSINNKFNIMVAPSIVYEALRARDEDVRQRLINIMLHRRWKRLMPEAYTHCEELLNEVRRLRPNWLRRHPDVASFRQCRSSWTRSEGGQWDLIRNNTQAAADLLEALEQERVVGAREESRMRRNAFREYKWTDFADLDNVIVRFKDNVDGWRGDDVEPWRVRGWSVITEAFYHEIHPLLDWLVPYIDVLAIIEEQRSWLEFWLYEIERSRMLTFWLLWAYEHVQSFRSLNDGAPADAQLATYFPSCDTVVSADKTFIWILDRIRPHCPCALPISFLVRGGLSGIDDLFAHFQASNAWRP